MRNSWIVYKEAEKKLKTSGILKRLERIDADLCIRTAVYTEDVIDSVKELQRSGVMEILPKAESNTFELLLNNAFNSFLEGYPPKWLIRKNDVIREEQMEIEDFLLLSGYTAFKYGILKKDELFNYKKFGFNNLLEFIGTIGAVMENASREKAKINSLEGLNWITKKYNGSQFISCIGGNMHYDLHIRQRDITEYETKDPFGNIVLYRPETHNDSISFSPIHSTEPDFLVLILQYAEQLGEIQKIINNGAKKYISYAKSLGQKGVAAAEHFISYGDRPKNVFDKTLLCEIPKLENNSDYVNVYSPYIFLSNDNNSHYSAYIGKDNELRIPLSQNPEIECVSFMPHDITKMLNGIIYQCAMGIGRTPVNQIINLLEYRCSNDYVKTKEKYSKLLLKK